MRGFLFQLQIREEMGLVHLIVAERVSNVPRYPVREPRVSVNVPRRDGRALKLWLELASPLANAQVCVVLVFATFSSNSSFEMVSARSLYLSSEFKKIMSFLHYPIFNDGCVISRHSVACAWSIDWLPSKTLIPSYFASTGIHYTFFV